MSKKEKKYRSTKLPAKLFEFYEKAIKILDIGYSLPTQLITHVLQEFALKTIKEYPEIIERKPKQEQQIFELEKTIEHIIGLKAEELEKIKSSINPEVMAKCLNGVLNKKKVLILTKNNLKSLSNSLLIFFDFLFFRTFEHNVVIKDEGIYKRNKELYKDYIIITGEVKEKDKVNILSSLVNGFYSNNNIIKGVINLRDKIGEIYHLSQEIIEYHQEQGLQTSNIKKMIRHLENNIKSKINKEYFKFLIEVVKSYFDIKLILPYERLGDYIEKRWGGSS